MKNKLTAALCGLLPLLGCSPGDDAGTASLLVFCGSANKPAIEEIAARFEEETGIRANIIFGGGGTLLSQMEITKKGDVYLTGSPDYIIMGERKKLLVEGSDRIVAYFIPAIITPRGNPAGIRSLDDLARPGVKVGIGNPETVAVGLYAIEILDANGLLEPVMRNVATFAESGAKTANLAALGHVDAVIGWRVFHFWNEEMTECVLIDPEKIPRISYVPIALPVFARNPGLSETFIEFVVSPYGRSAYGRYGYITSEKEARAFAPDASVGGEYMLPDEYFMIIKGERGNP